MSTDGVLDLLRTWWPALGAVARAVVWCAAWLISAALGVLITFNTLDSRITRLRDDHDREVKAFHVRLERLESRQDTLLRIEERVKAIDRSIDRIEQSFIGKAGRAHGE